MKRYRVCALTVGFIASELLGGCGSIILPYLSSYSLLNGGWVFTGNRATNQYPFLSASLAVDGNQVTALGDESVPCSNSPFPVMGSFQLSGQVESDGSFQLTDQSGSSANNLQIVITGKVPAPGQTTWTGSYSITNLPNFVPCTVNLAGPITAVPLTPLNGTYSGSFSSTSGQGNLQVSAHLSEGAPQFLAQPAGGEVGYISITGSISISGSSCFNGETVVQSPGNALFGDLLLLLDSPVSSGSEAALTGYYAAPDGGTLQNVTIDAVGGQCNGREFRGTLIRQ